MFGNTKARISNYKDKLVEFVTNANTIPKGNLMYAQSSIGRKTSAILRRESKYGNELRHAFERVSSQLHPDTTFDDFVTQIRKDGEGIQQIVSTHYNNELKEGFVGVFHGNFLIYDDEVMKADKDQYSEKNLLRAFRKVRKDNLRLSVPRGVVKDVADKKQLSYSFIESVIAETLNAAEDKNPDLKDKLKQLEKEILPKINEREVAGKTVLAKVVPYSSGSKKVWFYNVQLVKYAVEMMNPATGERINKESDPIKLAKTLGLKAESEEDAIASVLANYAENNKDKALVILTASQNRSEEKRAAKLGKLIQDKLEPMLIPVDAKTSGVYVPVEPIVEKPIYYRREVIDVKNNSLLKKWAFGAMGTVGLAALVAGGMYISTLKGPETEQKSAPLSVSSSKSTTTSAPPTVSAPDKPAGETRKEKKARKARERKAKEKRVREAAEKKKRELKATNTQIPESAKNMTGGITKTEYKGKGKRVHFKHDLKDPDGIEEIIVQIAKKKGDRIIGHHNLKVEGCGFGGRTPCFYPKDLEEGKNYSMRLGVKDKMGNKEYTGHVLLKMKRK